MSKFDIGQEPTREQFHTYWKVRAFLERENVANYLEYHEPDATPEQFERMCTVYSEYVFDDGEHDFELLCEAWGEVKMIKEEA